ncbi:hypothetical protein PEC18_12180 [Paucibacter sp. O1-1]|nr:hypothetical protein [Paucibacter sp. O1-1]MDA3826574.1 hypothetical protein [Paucibacter sp. O1-1]
MSDETTTTTPVLVTLADGTEVPDDSPAWRAECLARHGHVCQLRTCTLPARRAYLAELERTQGAEFALRVADAYMKDRERRKTAAS